MALIEERSSKTQAEVHQGQRSKQKANNAIRCQELSHGAIIIPAFHNISSHCPEPQTIFFPSLFPQLNAYAIYHFAC